MGEIQQDDIIDNMIVLKIVCQVRGDCNEYSCKKRDNRVVDPEKSNCEVAVV